MKIAFSVFHFDKSGTDSNEVHSKKTPIIFNTFSVFHFEISGMAFNEEQP